ncbi:MAG TPA: sulfotransferase [Candidatus Nanoarchaeia archaeon]|uniref:Sulfotransferase family protein n=1 Tax=uncultured archaeon Rifle_16ft_4_minimus_37913 TaxID=1665152 RepID=A0A0H4TRA4_9ARCH|nr:sulfotransferase family protein [uncultured archaeon Rifle_16ft_4_minimus_37913]HKZ33967.1 sulfotransferase [Candidatus Nanoarchaeia archaeon]
MRRPNLFIVGAGRSGTTTLYEWLKQHPDVFMSEVKGPNFFGEEPNPAFKEFHKNEKKYLSLFAKAGNKKILGEASHYFWSETAPKEIKKFNPEAKIIILLRHPMEIAYSYYKNGDIPNNIPFEESINLNTEDLKKMWEKLKFSRNLKNYLDAFGKKNVNIIFLDEMEKNPEKVYSVLCDFLRIDNRHPIKFEIHNKSRDLKNKWFLWVLEKLPTGFKLFLKSIIPKGKINKMRKSAINFTTQRQRKYSLKPDIRKKLNNRFKKEILVTGKFIGKDLSHWLK